MILVGAWHAFRALTRPIPPMPASLAFYPRIAALPLDDYRERVKALDHGQAIAEMLHDNYTLAILSVAKFRLVDPPVACVRSTFELWMLLLLMIALLREPPRPPAIAPPDDGAIQPASLIKSWPYHDLGSFGKVAPGWIAEVRGPAARSPGAAWPGAACPSGTSVGRARPCAG